MEYPNEEYGIVTTYLDSDEVKRIIAREYKTTDQNVELSTDVNATVRSIVRYEDLP